MKCPYCRSLPIKFLIFPYNVAGSVHIHTDSYVPRPFANRCSMFHHIYNMEKLGIELKGPTMSWVDLRGTSYDTDFFPEFLNTEVPFFCLLTFTYMLVIQALVLA